MLSSLEKARTRRFGEPAIGDMRSGSVERAAAGGGEGARAVAALHDFPSPPMGTGGAAERAQDIARRSAAWASSRVESSVGSGELASFINSGISVQPSTTASQPSPLSRAMTCWK